MSNEEVKDIALTIKGITFTKTLPPMNVLKWLLWKERSLWWRFRKTIVGTRPRKPDNYEDLIEAYRNPAVRVIGR